MWDAQATDITVLNHVYKGRNDGYLRWIYRATDMQTGQQVAIKIPHPEMEAEPVLFDRFKREAEIGERLDHPGVMKGLGGEEHSRIYMVMEWVEGRLLRQVLHEQKKFPVERALTIAIEILDALDYIHRNGVVHRDLKPENIMLDAEDHC
jgi:serine/threonine-protein kinase